MGLSKLTGMLVLLGIFIGGIAFSTAGARAAPLLPLQKIVESGDTTLDGLVEPVGKRKKYLKKKKRKKWKKRRKYSRKYYKRKKRHKRSKRYRRYDRIDPSGVILGVIIGNAIVNGPRYYDRQLYLPQAHVNSCYRRYRSYRLYDNTFQPYHGPRRPCVSRYWP